MQHEPKRISTLVIGAGPSGLAVGACLRKKGLPFEIIEKEHRVGSAWHRHYDRLSLNTPKRVSALPFMPFSGNVKRYPTKNQFIAYLNDYSRSFDLAPRFGEEALACQRIDGKWETSTASGRYLSNHLVVAVGNYREPYIPAVEGADRFKGSVLHSSEFKNGKSFAGQKVLVLGFGTSAGEILPELIENGAAAAVSLHRSASIVPHLLFGLDFLGLADRLNRHPTFLGLILTRLLIRTFCYEVDRSGLKAPTINPIDRIDRTGRFPLIDKRGVIRYLKNGVLKILPAIRELTADGAVFEGGIRSQFDAAIFCTGFEAGVSSILESGEPVLDYAGRPLVSGDKTPLPGLYFIGYRVSAAGILNRIGTEARRIADLIAGGFPKDFVG